MGRDARRGALGCALLSALTLAIYAQTAGFGFLTYDDNTNLTQNSILLEGLTPSTLRWAFTTTYTGNWMPLTWISHLAVTRVFGLEPAWHHGVNVLLHLSNTILLFGALQGLTGSFGRSLFVAAVFAAHPLHVESVAWVTERKDVLMVFFGSLSLLAWARWVRSRRFLWYLVSLALFVAALLSKAMIVVLPAVLLLLCFWPLGRLSFRAGRLVGLRGVLSELAPFFALSAAVGAVALVTQRAAGAMSLEGLLGPWEKAAHVPAGLLWYFTKTLWPSGLAAFYPYPIGGESGWLVLAGSLFAIAATAAGWLLRERAPFVLTGWSWFVVSLLPILGFVQVGEQAHADRYAYFGQTGLVVAAAWGCAHFATGRRAQLTLASLAAAAALALSVVARGNAACWRDSEALYRRALAVTEGNYVALANYGAMLIKAGRMSEAEPYLREAIRHHPRSGIMHNNLGLVLESTGKQEEALASWFESLRREPGAHETLANLARALARAGRGEESRAAQQESQRLEPEFPARTQQPRRGGRRRGDFEEALRLISLAAWLAPDEADFQRNLVAARQKQGGAGDAKPGQAGGETSRH